MKCKSIDILFILCYSRHYSESLFKKYLSKEDLMEKYEKNWRFVFGVVLLCLGPLSTYVGIEIATNPVEHPGLSPYHWLNVAMGMAGGPLMLSWAANQFHRFIVLAVRKANNLPE